MSQYLNIGSFWSNIQCTFPPSGVVDTVPQTETLLGYSIVIFSCPNRIVCCCFCGGGDGVCVCVGGGGVLTISMIVNFERLTILPRTFTQKNVPLSMTDSKKNIIATYLFPKNYFCLTTITALLSVISSFSYKR